MNREDAVTSLDLRNKLREKNTDLICYGPGPFAGFLKGIEILVFAVALLAFCLYFSKVKFSSEHFQVGLFFLTCGVLLHFYRKFSSMEIQIQEFGILKTQSFIRGRKSVLIPFRDILETDISLLTGVLELRLKNGACHRIAWGIVESPEDESEIELSYSERHQRIIERLKLRIDEKVSLASKAL